MQSFLIEIFEPWGEGIYVSEVKTITSNIESIIKLENGCTLDKEAFITEILINSGDKIQIISTKIQLI